MKENCPFCQEKIKLHMFKETGNMMALYNIAPILPGHSLIIPKRHVNSIFNLSDEEFSELFAFAKNVTQLLMNAFDADGFDWSLQESIAAGQSVAHLHLHLIPRKDGDLNHPGDWYALLQNHKDSAIDSPGRKNLNSKEMANAIAFINQHKSDDAV